MNKGRISKTSLLIGSALVATMLYGCGGGDDKKASATNEPAKSTASSAAPSKQKSGSSAENLDKKLSVYIKCYNSSRRIDDSINRYSSWVKDMEQGPTGKERNVYGLYSVNLKGITECKTKITDVAALAPVTDLDKAAVAFANDAETVGQLVDELYGYYDQKDYKDDDFKKGKELHSPFASSAKQYLISANMFADLIDVENDKRQVEQLAEIEKQQGKNANYYRLSIMIQSKKIANLLYEDNFSVDQVKELIDQYSKDVDAASDYYEDPNNKDAMKKLGIMTDSKLRSVISAAKDFNKSAKERYRSVRDNKPIRSSTPSTAKFTTGTVQNVQAKYNDLVNAFNR